MSGTYDEALSKERKKANESATESEEPEFLRKRRKRSIMPNSRELSVSPPPCLEDVVTEGKKNHAGFC